MSKETKFIGEYDIHSPYYVDGVETCFSEDTLPYIIWNGSLGIASIDRGDTVFVVVFYRHDVGDHYEVYLSTGPIGNGKRDRDSIWRAWRYYHFAIDGYNDRNAADSDAELYV